MALDTGILIAYGAILVMAVVPILMGARASVDLIKLNSAKKFERRSDVSGLEKETLSTNDAYWFPITGSTVLFGLYLLFKFLDKDHINTLLTGYFAMVGVYALTSVFSDMLAPIENLLKMDKYNIALTHERASKSSKSSKVRVALLYSMKFTHLSMIGAVLATLITAAYVLTKNWILNNMFGFALSVTAISLMDIDSFQTGMTLLSGLFIYDIFWVFGTDVMVTVAKSFDAPIKLLFPKTLDNFFLAKTGFTMLGLGDIVLPGIYVALSLRYDYHNYLSSLQKQQQESKRALKFSSSYATPYYHGALFAYVAGLTTTVWVMHTFQAAQPALLYLSPACILSTLIVSLARGELKAAFAYTSTGDKELKDKLIGVSPKAQKNEAAKAKTSDSESSSSGEENSQDDHESDDESASRRPRKVVNATSPRKVTGSSKSTNESNRAGKIDESAEAAAERERKRKRREAERFDFDEQGAAPVTKRVHAAQGKQEDEDDGNSSNPTSAARPGTRDTVLSADEASISGGGATAGKGSKKSKKSAVAAAAASTSTSSAPAVFTEAVAGTGVGKSAGKKKNNANNNNNAGGASTKKSASPSKSAQVPSKRPSSPGRASSPSRSTDAGASTAGDDDEFMVVSRKGRKSNKARANFTGTDDDNNTISSPPLSFKAATKQASVSDDISGQLLADPADWGF